MNADNVNPSNNNDLRANAQLVRCVSESINSSLLADTFDAYYCARKGKRNTHSQIRFERNLLENIVSLVDEIENGRYKPGKSMCFIYKERQILREVFAASFRDRVVHWLVYNYIYPVLTPTFIYDSYSCIEGRGTLFGIKRLEHHIRSCSDNFSKTAWILKCDVQGFFMNINREKLLQIVIDKINAKKPNLFSEYDFLPKLIHTIIMSDPTKSYYTKGNYKNDKLLLPKSKSLFFSPKGCGLPIGNLTSQLLSNVYLNEFDQFVKRTLKFKHYGRYVDDFFIVSDNKEELLAKLPLIREFLSEELGLILHPKKFYLQPIEKGVTFLGAFIKPHCRLMVRKQKSIMYRRLEELQTFDYPLSYVKTVHQSYKAYASNFYDKVDGRYFSIYL